MIRTIIIDDEENSISTMEILLSQYCPEVVIIDKCQNSVSAITAIQQLQPDLLLLDIEMPVTTGLELLQNLHNYRGSVIFVTAHHQYAIQAIKHSALDYLLKPVDPEELVKAIKRLLDHKNHSFPEQFQFLLDKLSQKDHAVKKIAIPNFEGFKLVSIEEIIFCEAEDNYTFIHLKKNEKLLASRTLKEIQQVLSHTDYFIRVHHSYLVNINEINQYMRGDGGYVVMSNGRKIGISRNKKDDLLKKLIGK